MWEEGVWRIYFTIQPQSVNTSYIHPSNIFQQRTIWNENRQVRRASRVLCWAGKVEAEWNWSWASFSKLTQNILTVARARLAESWEGGCLNSEDCSGAILPSLALPCVVQTNLVNWNLIPAISKTSSKNVIIVRSPKHIRAWVELAGWQNTSQSRDALETKDWSKQWNLLGGVEEVLSRWLNGKWQYAAVEAAASEPDLLSWSLLQDIGLEPRCSLQRLSFKQDQHCLDHTLTSLKRKVFSASNTIHNFLQCRQLFWLRVWTWQKSRLPRTL